MKTYITAFFLTLSSIISFGQSNDDFQDFKNTLKNQEALECKDCEIIIEKYCYAFKYQMTFEPSLFGNIKSIIKECINQRKEKLNNETKNFIGLLNRTGKGGGGPSSYGNDKGWDIGNSDYCLDVQNLSKDKKLEIISKFLSSYEKQVAPNCEKCEEIMQTYYDSYLKKNNIKNDAFFKKLKSLSQQCFYQRGPYSNLTFKNNTYILSEKGNCGNKKLDEYYKIMAAMVKGGPSTYGEDGKYLLSLGGNYTPIYDNNLTCYNIQGNNETIDELLQEINEKQKSQEAIECKDCEIAIEKYCHAYQYGMTFDSIIFGNFKSIVQECINQRNDKFNSRTKNYVNIVSGLVEGEGPSNYGNDNGWKITNSDFCIGIQDLSNTQKNEMISNFFSKYEEQIAPNCDKCEEIMNTYYDAFSTKKKIDDVSLFKIKSIVIKCLSQRKEECRNKRLDNIYDIMKGNVSKGGPSTYGEDSKWKITKFSGSPLENKKIKPLFDKNKNLLTIDNAILVLNDNQEISDFSDAATGFSIVVKNISNDTLNFNQFGTNNSNVCKDCFKVINPENQKIAPNEILNIACVLFPQNYCFPGKKYNFVGSINLVGFDFGKQFTVSFIPKQRPVETNINSNSTTNNTQQKKSGKCDVCGKIIEFRQSFYKISDAVSSYREITYDQYYAYQYDNYFRDIVYKYCSEKCAKSVIDKNEEYVRNNYNRLLEESYEKQKKESLKKHKCKWCNKDFSGQGCSIDMSNGKVRVGSMYDQSLSRGYDYGDFCSEKCAKEYYYKN